MESDLCLGELPLGGQVERRRRRVPSATFPHPAGSEEI